MDQAAIVQPDGRGGCPGDPSLEASPQSGVILRSRRARSADDQTDGNYSPSRHVNHPFSSPENMPPYLVKLEA